ncbi:MAG: arginine repressor [Elusimicrobia bacterium]|nr:arginine repressor [Elusimicrobiota bacterium]
MNIQTAPAERKRQRQQAVLEAIGAEPLATQQDIARALRKKGIDATQVSISRDISELGLVKAAGRYVSGHPAAPPVADPLAALVKAVAAAGPNLVVVKCDTGAAPRVGLALDQLGLPGVVGTLAGDDTVFAAVSTAADNTRLVRLLQSRIPAVRTGPGSVGPRQA